MTMLVADTFVETAVRAGVERVCGVIGDSLNPIAKHATQRVAALGSRSP